MLTKNNMPQLIMLTKNNMLQLIVNVNLEQHAAAHVNQENMPQLIMLTKNNMPQLIMLTKNNMPHIIINMNLMQHITCVDKDRTTCLCS